MSRATDELSILSEHLERFRGVTLQTLAMVPADKLNWRPAEKTFSIGEQFLHIAQVQEFYSAGFLGEGWNPDVFKPPADTLSHEGLRQRLGGASREALRRLSAIDPARLDAVVAVPNVPVEWPLRSWLWYLVEHEIHHKAQLAIYLRLIGVTPPFFAFVLPAGMRPDIR